MNLTKQTNFLASKSVCDLMIKKRYFEKWSGSTQNHPQNTLHHSWEFSRHVFGVGDGVADA